MLFFWKSSFGREIEWILRKCFLRKQGKLIVLLRKSKNMVFKIMRMYYDVPPTTIVTNIILKVNI